MMAVFNQRLTQLQNWLIEPSSSVHGYEARLKSRWLASVFLFFIPFSITVVLIPPLAEARPAWIDPQVDAVFAFSFVFLGATYFLSRRGHYKSASLLAIAISTITILTISLLDDDIGNTVNDAYYLIAVLMFSSIMLSQRITSVLFIITIASLVYLTQANPRVNMEDILKGPLSLMIMVFLLLVFGAHLRNTLEKHHITALKNENAERQHAEERLRDSLQEKELLLKEIHHRVKNNLQVISSLLNLQSNASDNPLMVSQFQDSQNRIRSMALIHERLYRSGDLAHVDFKEYLQDLTSHLVQSYQAHRRGIGLQIMIGDIHFDIDTAIPCGLLITELVSNALKHAFPIAGGHGGEICVQMCGTDNKQYELVVQDDGIGFPERLDWRNTTSLGLQLVNSLTRQLSGTVDLEAHSGTRFTIRFSGTKQNEASQ